MSRTRTLSPELRAIYQAEDALRKAATRLATTSRPLGYRLAAKLFEALDEVEWVSSCLALIEDAPDRGPRS